MKEADSTEFMPVKVSGSDEIAHLGSAWNALHKQLADNYRQLAEENKRQEVFLRASSHQLKTPVAATLLLVNGMIDEVGKYKETRDHLPVVKEQLLSMQRMINDILYLNRQGSNLLWQSIEVTSLVRDEIGRQEVLIGEKELAVCWQGEMEPVDSDEACLRVILGNILSNAVGYTPAGGVIKITAAGDRLVIFNQTAAIDEELLSNIFEPFVTGNTGQKGRGLGLYIASYYSRLLGCLLTIENVDNGVEVHLTFNASSNATQ
jgi:signal transduction histidine kinase